MRSPRTETQTLPPPPPHHPSHPDAPTATRSLPSSSSGTAPPQAVPLLNSPRSSDRRADLMPADPSLKEGGTQRAEAGREGRGGEEIGG
eukprot:3729373-Rhodomonas_salina.1